MPEVGSGRSAAQLLILQSLTCLDGPQTWNGIGAACLFSGPYLLGQSSPSQWLLLSPDGGWPLFDVYLWYHHIRCDNFLSFLEFLEALGAGTFFVLYHYLTSLELPFANLEAIGLERRNWMYWMYWSVEIAYCAGSLMWGFEVKVKLSGWAGVYLLCRVFQEMEMCVVINTSSTPTSHPIIWNIAFRT